MASKRARPPPASDAFAVAWQSCIPTLSIRANHAVRFRLRQLLEEQYGLVLAGREADELVYHLEATPEAATEAFEAVLSRLSSDIGIARAAEVLELQTHHMALAEDAKDSEVRKAIEMMCSASGWRQAEQRFRLVAGDDGLKKALLRDVPHAIKLEPKAATHVAYVRRGPEGLLWGLCGADQHFPQRATVAALRAGKRVSRAYWKLAEAAQRNARLREALARGRDQDVVAIDLGAAPGGWTEFLAEHSGVHAVAIDSGQMDAGLAASERVRVLQMSVEESLNAAGAETGAPLDAALRDLAGEAGAAPAWPIVAVVCDMNCHVEASMALLERLGAHLGAPRLNGAALVLTTKLVHRGHNEWKKLQEVIATRLRAIGVAHIRSLHLLSNRRHERTVLGVYDTTSVNGMDTVARIPGAVPELRSRDQGDPVPRNITLA